MRWLNRNKNRKNLKQNVYRGWQRPKRKQPKNRKNESDRKRSKSRTRNPSFRQIFHKMEAFSKCSRKCRQRNLQKVKSPMTATKKKRLLKLSNRFLLLLRSPCLLPSPRLKRVLLVHLRRNTR